MVKKVKRPEKITVRPTERTLDSLVVIAENEEKTCSAIVNDLVKIVGNIDPRRWPEIRGYLQAQTQFGRHAKQGRFEIDED